MTDSRLTAASSAADRKDWNQAADLLATGAQTDEVLDKRGWYLSRAKRYDEAVAVFLDLRRRRPRDHRPPYMLGYQHYSEQKWDESVRWFDEALEHKPDHIKSLWRKAHALDQAGKTKQAAITAGRILRLWHGLSPGRQDEDRRLVGRASFLLGKQQAARDPAGAIDLLAQAVELESDDPYKHYQVAKALRRSGRTREALEPAQRAHKLKPGDPNIAVEFAEALHASGRSSEAAEVLGRFARRCRGWKASQAGLLALRLGDAGVAVDLLERAVRDKSVRADKRSQDALAEAKQKAKERDSRSPRHSESERGRRQHRGGELTKHSTTHGRVAVVRKERGFGFLVDDDGIRRHFRLSDNSELVKGQEVQFTPTEQTKGPAALHVHPA